MSQSVIRSYFETRLKTWADAQSPAIAIAYEGMPFTKPVTAPYLELFLLPASTTNPSTEAVRRREIGIFQINVVVADGKGSKESQNIAEAIITLFPVVPKGIVSVEQTPHVGHPLVNLDGKRVLPVSITYRYES